ncbi:MAG: hypothetical protein R2873_04745 [Caldilineaceae bacterium]
MRLSEQSGVPLTELSVAQLQSLHPAFGDDVLAVWDYEQSVDARDATGGTSRRAVLEQIGRLRGLLAAN